MRAARAAHAAHTFRAATGEPWGGVGLSLRLGTGGEGDVGVRRLRCTM